MSLISTKRIDFTYSIWEKPVFEQTYSISSSSDSSSSYVSSSTWGALFTIIIIGGIVASIIYIIKMSRKKYAEGKAEAREKMKPKPKQNDNKYLEILKERLAKGEITKEEYDKLKKEFE